MKGANANRPWTGLWVARDAGFTVKSVEGIYRNGKVELAEPLAEAEGLRLIVTWVRHPEAVNLRERGIDEDQAADLHRRGVLVLVLFPDSNLRTSKRRPALIL